MSRLISEVLRAPEPSFSQAIKKWEQISGQSGHDIRLLSDITQARKRALQTLNLDENDTTARELFFALRHRAVETNRELELELQINDTDTPDQIISKIVAFIDGLTVQREVWVIKHSVIKQLLKKHSPKKVLKMLGFRSIDSVLKRSNSYELLALAYQIESSDWVAKMHTHFKKLKPTDFQATKSCMFVVEPSRVAKLHSGGYKRSNIIVPNYETGTVLVVPPTQRFPLDVLTLTLSLLQMLYELRAYSAYFRLLSVKTDFGSRLQALMKNGLPGALHETQIGWKVLQRHLMSATDSFVSVEQPHLQYDDIVLTAPIPVLAEVLPSMPFWNDNSYVFMTENNRPVSLHLLDVVVNASNQLPYESGVATHLQQHLWEELGLRYLQNPEVEAFTLSELTDD
ncbi:MAG: hypothetical protein ACR2FM_05310 [Candidatus Saccharimonadales bacterium]